MGEVGANERPLHDRVRVPGESGHCIDTACCSLWSKEDLSDVVCSFGTVTPVNDASEYLSTQSQYVAHVDERVVAS